MAWYPLDKCRLLILLKPIETLDNPLDYVLA